MHSGSVCGWQQRGVPSRGTLPRLQRRLVKNAILQPRWTLSNGAAVIKTQEVALLYYVLRDQNEKKKTSGVWDSPKETAPFWSIASGLELNKRSRRNSNIEFYRNAGGLWPESDQRMCRGGRRERKRARGNERSAGREQQRESLFIFHLVPVSLLFTNFPYVGFTLTAQKNFSNVTFIRPVSPSRGHDFSANARPLTLHGHVLNDRFSAHCDRKISRRRECDAAGSDTRALGIRAGER